MIRKTVLAALVGSLALGLTACEKEGAGERVGEEFDEAVDTMKNGGEESVGTKVDDAVDRVREDAREIGDAAKND
jgi:hypothetical protein